MDINMVWNGALSLFVGLFAYVAHEKFRSFTPAISAGLRGCLPLMVTLRTP